MLQDQEDSNLPFPAHAGMNRYLNLGRQWTETVPRTRGDEPSPGYMRGVDIVRSPHTRG